MVLPARSEIDLISGPATRTATNASGDATGPDIRSAAVVAAAICSWIVPVVATPTVEGGSTMCALGAAALPGSCRFVCEERSGASPALVATTVDFDFFLVLGTAWRAGDLVCLCQAAVDMSFVGAGSLLGGSASIGTRAAVTQANGFW